MEKDSPIFDPAHMAPFDEDDTFHVREYWDARYNVSVNVSVHDIDMEIAPDCKRAQIRLQTGDPITDHIVEHVSHDLNMEPLAIATNMSATNWTPPPGWHVPARDEGDQGRPLDELMEGAYYFPPRASYATWGESRSSGTSRWALRVDAKTGPFSIGALVPPLTPPGKTLAYTYTYARTYTYTPFQSNLSMASLCAAPGALRQAGAQAHVGGLGHRPPRLLVPQ